jgi:hypothetical protein
LYRRACPDTSQKIKLHKTKTRISAGIPVSAAGIEPATNGLKGHCSAIELRAPSPILSARDFITPRFMRQQNQDFLWEFWAILQTAQVG